MPSSDNAVVGWDVGGAHVKACVLQGGEVVDVAQWACPLWQGLDQLERVLQQAHARWPAMGTMRHAVTMTGEMVDLFRHREEGVQRIAATMAAALPTPRYFAGDDGWCEAGELAGRWAQIASANWLATAQHAAQCLDEGVLIDIGSTTTDLIAFRGGRVLSGNDGPLPSSSTPTGGGPGDRPALGAHATARSDVQRLATGELVYHGVVRTPLCALTRQIAWRGNPLNVMNEYFATVADVYRLTGELNPAHDLYPPADNAAKDLDATRARLARMIGLDARDGSPADWLDFALAWRGCQVAEIGSQLRRVMTMHGLGGRAVVVSAGCGDFLVPDVLASAIGPGAASGAPAVVPYGSELARIAPHDDGSEQAADQATDRAAWAQVCAPCVAVAMLSDRERR